MLNSNLKKFYCLFILLLSCLITTAQASSYDDVLHAYKNWVSAMETGHGNPTPVVKLYAPHAILLATYSPILMNANNQLNDYFAKLTALKNLHVQLDKIITNVYGDTATNNGLYTFIYTDDNGKEVRSAARFTFVYKKIDSQWLIITHHSSVVPKAD